MPQAGSYTRAIKVQRLETAIRAAAASLNAAESPADRRHKARTARRLAAQLLTARTQMLRSRLADMQPKGLPDQGLRAKQDKLQAGGIDSILVEFGAECIGEMHGVVDSAG